MRSGVWSFSTNYSYTTHRCANLTLLYLNYLYYLHYLHYLRYLKCAITQTSDHGTSPPFKRPISNNFYKVYNCISLANEKYHQTQSEENNLTAQFCSAAISKAGRNVFRPNTQSRNRRIDGLCWSEIWTKLVSLWKIPSKMEVPPHYKLLTQLTLFALFTLPTMLSLLPLLTLFTLLTLLSLLNCLHYLQCLQCLLLKHCVVRTQSLCHSGIYRLEICRDRWDRQSCKKFS